MEALLRSVHTARMLQSYGEISLGDGAVFSRARAGSMSDRALALERWTREPREREVASVWQSCILFLLAQTYIISDFAIVQPFTLRHIRSATIQNRYGISFKSITQISERATERASRENS